MITYSIHKLPKGTAVNILDDNQAYCGHVVYGDRRKAAGKSFLTACDSAKHYGLNLTQSDIFDALNKILHGEVR